MRSIRALLVAAPCFLLSASPAAAAPESDALPSDPPYALANTQAWFLGLEFATVASLVTLNVVAGSRGESCGWCSTNAFDRSVRDVFLASNPEPVGVASRILSRGVIGALALTSVIVPAVVSDHDSYAVIDSIIVLNSALFTLSISEFTKVVADRQRPAFHYGVESETEANDEPTERFMSFISGDAAWAFSLASSATTLSYLRGYVSAPYVLAGGAVLAATSSVMRIAADMHWATDVLVGASIGTASGVLIPLVFHHRESSAADFLLLPEVSMGRVGFNLIVPLL